MAKDKSSFVLYTDLIHTIKKLAKTPNGKIQVADLFITILEYVNDENPIPEDPMVEIIFEPIKQQMKRDLKKYERTVESKKEGAALGNLKRWNPDLHQLVLDGKTSLQDAIFKADERKAALSLKNNRICDNLIAPHRRSDQLIADNVNVNDNVTVNDKNIDSTLSFPFSTSEFMKSWEKWVQYRIEIKKPYMTFSSKQAELQTLGMYPETEAIKMINTSLKNGWKNIRPDLDKKQEAVAPLTSKSILSQLPKK